MRPPYGARRWLTDIGAVRDQWRVVLAAVLLSALAGWLAPIVLIDADHTADATVWTGGPGVTPGLTAGITAGADGTLVQLLKSTRSVSRIAERSGLSPLLVRRDLDVSGYTVVTITSHASGATPTARLLRAAVREATDTTDPSSAAAVAALTDGTAPRQIDAPSSPASDRGLVPSLKQAVRGGGVGLLVVVVMVIGLALARDEVRSRRDLGSVLEAAVERPVRRTSR